MEVQVYHFTWRGIEIEAVYVPLRWGVIAQLLITSIAPARAPLPISETGHRSHFFPPDTIDSRGDDVVAQVIAWLDEEANSPKWRRAQEAARQLSLF